MKAKPLFLNITLLVCFLLDFHRRFLRVTNGDCRGVSKTHSSGRNPVSRPSLRSMSRTTSRTYTRASNHRN